MKQIEVQMKEVKKARTISLIGEIIYSNNEDLKPFVKQGKIRLVKWVYFRFIDIFGESKKPYLLDIAIMFIGILIQNIRFHHLAYGTDVNIHAVVRYSIKRLIKMVDEVAESNDQLLEPEILGKWLPDWKNDHQGFQAKIIQRISILKKLLDSSGEQSKFMELLDCVQAEFENPKPPRKYLIECIFESMKSHQEPDWQLEIDKLKQLIKAYYDQLGQQ